MWRSVWNRSSGCGRGDRPHGHRAHWPAGAGVPGPPWGAGARRPRASWEHIDIRMGARRTPRPQAQGGPASARVRHRPCSGSRERSTVRRLPQPPSESAIYLRAPPDYRPNWSGYRFRPKVRPDDCWSKRAANVVLMASTSAKEAPSLRLDHGGLVPRGSRRSTRPGSAQTDRSRGRARLRTSECPVQPDHSGWRSSTWLSSTGSDSPDRLSARPTSVWLRRRPELLGLLPASAQRDLDQVRRILDPGRQARGPQQSRRATRQGRAGDPARTRTPLIAAFRARVQDVTCHAGMEPVRERGELVARGVALAAAIAVSLLVVSGAGGAATQQTPKRGGTVVFRGRPRSSPA